MALPSKRLSRPRTRSRAAHHHLDPKQLVVCESCKVKILSHHMCPNCGTYKKREVVKM